MTFTQEQLEILSKYESNFNTAINADWSRAVGRTGTETIYNIWKAATGTPIKVNPNCSHCVLTLLKDVGRLYFADKAAQANRVSVAEETPAPVRAAVKTTARKGRPKKAAE